MKLWKLVRIVFSFTVFYHFEELVMMNRQLDGVVNQEERAYPVDGEAPLKEQRSNETPNTSESIDDKKEAKVRAKHKCPFPSCSPSVIHQTI